MCGWCTRRHSLTYPAPVGRNFDEILRAIDALQLSAKYKVATPADWTKGKETVILPTIPDAEAQGLFPKGWKTLKPYLRMTPDPSV